MSNPDVPNLEACVRLAKAGYPQGSYTYAYSSVHATDVFHVSLLAHHAMPGIIAAPTIGEMLAEIRRRGWEADITDNEYDAHRTIVMIFPTKDEDYAALKKKVGEAAEYGYSITQEDSPADALALALAEAMEKGGAHV